MSKNSKIFICATEQSGDNIGYNIIKKLINANKDLIIDGVGGSKMSEYLNNQFYSLNDFKSLGIIEIILSIKKYIKILNNLVSLIKMNNYDLIITIDSPDFNYPLVKKLRNKKFDKKIIHIVAPTVWAWRPGRAKKFAKIYNEILVLFKFEIKYFESENLNTTFIGHPIHYINNITRNNNNNELFIAFLPGSRFNEVEKLFRYFELAYQYLNENFKYIKIFIPTLPHLESFIRYKVKNWKIETIITTNLNEIESNFLKTNKAIVCSGTASLEVAKRNIPQFIIYKLNFFTEIIIKNFTNIKYANILNIIENRLIIPEITNSNLNKKSFLCQLKKLLNDEVSNTNQINSINNSLGKFALKEAPYDIAVRRIEYYL